MALAGRSPRRAGGSRLLVFALVITLVVLLIDASIKSRSPAPTRQLSDQAWVDQALPLIRASTEQGQQISTVRTTGLSMSAEAIATQVNQTAAASAATYQQARKLVAPSDLESASGLLDACLLVREKSAAAVARALVSTLSGPATPSAAASTALADAAQKFQVGDQVYQLFTQSLPGVGVTMPSSEWDVNADLYQTPQLAVYLAALRSSKNLDPVHRVEVQAVSTTPPAESLVGGVQVLPVADSVTVDIVVANVGNQVENDLTVTAGILPAVTAPSAREYLEPLQPGVAQSLTVGPLYPVVGKPITLTVTVTGLATSPTPSATKVLTFEMPSASTPLTTTTTSTVPPINAGGGPSSRSTPGGTTTPGGTVTPGGTTTPGGTVTSPGTTTGARR
jgi:hypothetical protein